MRDSLVSIGLHLEGYYGNKNIFTSNSYKIEKKNKINENTENPECIVENTQIIKNIYCLTFMICDKIN